MTSSMNELASRAMTHTITVQTRRLTVQFHVLQTFRISACLYVATAF